MDNEIKHYLKYLCFSLLCEEGLSVGYFEKKKGVVFYNRETPIKGKNYYISFYDLYNRSEDSILETLRRKLYVY